MVETFAKPSPWCEGICHPAFPSPEPVPKLLMSVAGLGRTRDVVLFVTLLSLYFFTYHPPDPYDDKKDPTTEIEALKVMIRNGVITRAIHVHDSDL